MRSTSSTGRPPDHAASLPEAGWAELSLEEIYARCRESVDGHGAPGPVHPTEPLARVTGCRVRPELTEILHGHLSQHPSGASGSCFAASATVRSPRLPIARYGHGLVA